MPSAEFIRQAYPEDLPRSRASLALVAGSPGSGKSTFIQKYAGADDFIIDMDLEATRLGVSRFATDMPTVISLLKARNDRLRELGSTTCSKAWFCLTAPKIAHRWHFIKRLQPKACFVIWAPLSVCLKRMQENRPDADSTMFDAARRWHRDFRAHPKDRMVKSL